MVRPFAASAIRGLQVADVVLVARSPLATSPSVPFPADRHPLSDKSLLLWTWGCPPWRGSSSPAPSAPVSHSTITMASPVLPLICLQSSDRGPQLLVFLIQSCQICLLLPDGPVRAVDVKPAPQVPTSPAVSPNNRGGRLQHLPVDQGWLAQLEVPPVSGQHL